MTVIFSKIDSYYRQIKSKIIFYPTLLALCGLLFAFIMMYLEERGISHYLIENVPVLVLNNGDTALTILSVCITGLISMMVFSFSMVMLLLNQASTNYSPRLLPGLISDQKHQIILGIYLSSILYCIFILFSIQPTGDQYQIPGFSVLLGILFTVACFYSFIYFIHNISQSIQITHILDRIFLSAESTMQKLLKNEEKEELHFPETENWHEYLTEKSGYFQDFSTEAVLNFCKENETLIEVIPVKGMFVLEGIPLIRSKKELTEDEVSTLLNYFHFSREELVSNNYVLAFKQITEVIAKAMSPGINDPGTALNAIDYLTELFRLRMLKNDESFITKDDKVYIKVTTVTFEDLLYNVLASIRTYCKQDIIVVRKLGTMFFYLQSQKAAKEDYYECLKREAGRLLDDAENMLDNRKDLEILDRLAQKLELHRD
ncbi:DUF2254 domain-containing protein [Salinimicrobium soli]|uniref:DUF2254 domain-containing protein n=1 Tax=Salinimicrobium soli TaxID=1254399 RepID=UPI003AB06E58